MNLSIIQQIVTQDDQHCSKDCQFFRSDGCCSLRGLAPVFRFPTSDSVVYVRTQYCVENATSEIGGIR